MAEKIIQWKSDNGKLYDSELEAALADARYWKDLAQRYKSKLSSNTSEQGIRLKLIQNGLGRRENVKVVNADTGELIRGVQKIHYEASVESYAKLVIETVDFDVDIDPAQVTIINRDSEEKQTTESS